jgi:hypothetical protein
MPKDVRAGVLEPHTFQTHAAVSRFLTNGDVPARASSVDEHGGEGLHPAVDRDVIHADASFAEQLLDIAVRQPVAQIPAHRDPERMKRTVETR